MDGSKIESGLQLFSRLNQRPVLARLHPTIFPNGGPRPNEFTEITGASKTGKTLLITDLIARCILPKEYKGIILSGQNCGAILMDTNHQFSMFKLISVMEALVKEGCKELPLASVESIIKSSLSKLIVLNCYGSQQLHMTFLNLETILSDNEDVGLIVLDGISTYYWEYRNRHGIISALEYHTRVLKALENNTRNLNVAVIFTKNDEDVRTFKEINMQYGSYKIIMNELEGKFHLDICDIKRNRRTLYCTFDDILKFVET